MTIIKENNTKRFRLRGLKFLFTYHDSKNILSKLFILNQVEEKFKDLGFSIRKYFLVCEKEKNPAIPYYQESQPGKHYHFYIELNAEGEKIVDISDFRYFDILIF